MTARSYLPLPPPREAPPLGQRLRTWLARRGLLGPRALVAAQRAVLGDEDAMRQARHREIAARRRGRRWRPLWLAVRGVGVLAVILLGVVAGAVGAYTAALTALWLCVELLHPQTIAVFPSAEARVRRVNHLRTGLRLAMGALAVAKLLPALGRWLT